MSCMEGDFNVVTAVCVQCLGTVRVKTEELCAGTTLNEGCLFLYRALRRTEMNDEIKIDSVLTLLHQHTDVSRSA
jgi:hypothetical protein